MSNDETNQPNPDYDPELDLRTGADSLRLFGLTAADDPWWLAHVEPALGEKGPLSIKEILGKVAAAEPVISVVEGLSIPQEYRSTLEIAQPAYALFVSRAFLDAFNPAEGTPPDFGIDRIRVGAPMLPATEPCPPYVEPDPGSIEVDDETVVMAVIDNGMAIGHDLFRREKDGRLVESRVDFFLNMEKYRPLRKDENGDVIDPGCLGQLFNKGEIDALLVEHTGTTGLLDEAGFYRDLGLIDWSTMNRSTTAQRVSHGTHVMGLAAGYRPDCDIGAKRRIIAVQLPTGQIANPEGRDLLPALTAAFDVISTCYRAYRVGTGPARPPIVVNFSFGDFSGSHDDNAKVARALDTRTLKLGVPDGPSLPPNPIPPKLLVLPSGNGNLARCHAKMEIPKDGTERSIAWRVLPSDRTWSYVEAWLPAGAEPVLLKVTAPDGSFRQIVGNATKRLAIETGAGTKIGEVIYRAPRNNEPRGHFLVQIIATEDLDGEPVAPSGRWRLSFARTTNGADIPLDLWVRRDETLPGFAPLGRQAYFDETDYVRFDEPSGRPKATDPEPGEKGHDAQVRRAGTISGIATGADAAVIAGNIRSNKELADYSAAGPTGVANAYRDGIDVAAVSDDSPVLAGVLSAGSASGSMVAMRGTSVAAPRAARVAADEIAAAKGLVEFDRKKLRDMGTGAGNLPPTRIGGGRLDRPSVFGKHRWKSPD